MSTKKPQQLPSLRRLGRVVNDGDGKASIEWIDASPDYQCPTVELKGLDSGLAVELEKTEEPVAAHDPYSNLPDWTRKTVRRRTNLRQLSEWIKIVRQVKQTKAAASEDD